MPTFSPTATRRLIEIGIRERDAILAALRTDRRHLGLRFDREDFQAGRVEGFRPTGETVRLLDRLQPRVGYGVFQAAVQAANADAIAAGLGELLPLLKAVHVAHTAVLDEAREAAGKTDRLATLENHCLALTALIDVVRSCGVETPVATDGKRRRGRPNTAKRNKEWLVLWKRKKFKTKVALADHLKVDRSTLSKGLKQASEVHESM